MRGTVEQFALLGENQPARMAMKQRYRELCFQSRYLPRHGRLRQSEALACVRE
jgi:hypothetical protein